MKISFLDVLVFCGLEYIVGNEMQDNPHGDVYQSDFKSLHYFINQFFLLLARFMCDFY